MNSVRYRRAPSVANHGDLERPSFVIMVTRTTEGAVEPRTLKYSTSRMAAQLAAAAAIPNEAFRRCDPPAGNPGGGASAGPADEGGAGGAVTLESAGRSVSGAMNRYPRFGTRSM